MNTNSVQCLWSNMSPSDRRLFGVLPIKLKKAERTLIRSYFYDPCGTLLLKEKPEQTNIALKIANAIGIWKTVDLFAYPRPIPKKLKGITV